VRLLTLIRAKLAQKAAQKRLAQMLAASRASFTTQDYARRRAAAKGRGR